MSGKLVAFGAVTSLFEKNHLITEVRNIGALSCEMWTHLTAEVGDLHPDFVAGLLSAEVEVGDLHPDFVVSSSVFGIDSRSG